MPKLPFKILGIEHVGIAVKDLNSISEIFGDLLGLDLHRREKVDDQQVITDIYHAGKDKLEFLKATSPDSPIAKFLGKGPEGMHHIALGVEEEDDPRAQIAVLDEKGIGHSGIVDRGKWKALSFKGPEGLLFELATRGLDIGAGAAS